jgi:hypothetical protein
MSEMSSESFPSDYDDRDLEAVHDLLAAHGIVPSAQGYDLQTLAAAIYARGWKYGVDRVEGSFRAEIRSNAAAQGQWQGFQLQSPAYGTNGSMAGALAIALSQALAHRDASSQ